MTSSGQSYDITHPDLVLVAKRFLIIGMPSNDNPSQIEAASRVAVMYVTDLQDMPNPTTQDANGPAA